MTFAFTAVKLNNGGGQGVDAEPPQIARWGDKFSLRLSEEARLPRLKPAGSAYLRHGL
jgi:hypothetical protein